MTSKPPPDWEAIEREYRAGQLSVSEIGRQHGISHTAINKRANRDGWTRNLAARVREEVSARLVSDGVSSANARETVDAAATRVVELVRSHRSDIGRARDVASRIINELDMATAHRDEIAEEIEALCSTEPNDSDAAKARAEKRRAAMHRAVSLPSRASSMQSLAGALKTIVQLERQAFNVDAGADENEPATKGDIQNVVSKLSREQRDSLRSIAQAIAGEPTGDTEGA